MKEMVKLFKSRCYAFSNGKFILEEEASEILSDGTSPMPQEIEIKPAQDGFKKNGKINPRSN